MERIITVQWNIGGGMVRDPQDEGQEDASYAIESIEEVVRVLTEASPDIVTLQEVHADADRVQAIEIAHAIGLDHVVYDVYADSHIEEGQKLGQAVLSRFPIVSHDFTLFQNPHLTLTRSDGGVWKSHDKGVTKCILETETEMMEVQTLHAIPFRRFSVDPFSPDLQDLRNDMAEKLRVKTPRCLIQGDFNFDDDQVAKLLPSLSRDAFQEKAPKEPTTPKGRKYDHVLYRGMNLSEQTVIQTLTDHFPVRSVFRLA